MNKPLSAAALERRRELDLLRTLPELLTHHLEKRADMPIYTQWSAKEKTWKTYSVKETVDRVNVWRHALAAEGLNRGERVAMLLPNCFTAVVFDQAALACALTPVPLHAVDTAGSSSYIMNDSQARVLVTAKKAKWEAIRDTEPHSFLKTVVITDDEVQDHKEDGIRVVGVEAWLAGGAGAELPAGPEPTDLAALVYTSGTTGKPKGVMLTHRAILANVTGVLQNVCPEAEDVWFSFPAAFSHL